MVVDEFVVNVFFRLLMNLMLILQESMKILHLLAATSRTIYSSDIFMMLLVPWYRISVVVVAVVVGDDDLDVNFARINGDSA